MTKYDLIIIGSGPAGYAAALHAGRMGIKTLVIEKEVLGGECLNYACIPLKTLLHHAVLKRRVDELVKKGLYKGSIMINTDVLNQVKRDIVISLRRNLESMMKKHGIDIVYGEAVDIEKHKVIVEVEGSYSEFEGENIFLAMGSRPTELPNVPIDGKYIVSSRRLIELDEVPGRLCIVGGGVIGVEIATLYSILGSDVTIVELMPNLLPTIDKDISKRLLRSIKRRGIKVYLESSIEEANVINGKVMVKIRSGSDFTTQEFDKLLISIGRKPNTHYDFIKKLGIKLDEHHFIMVDETQKTNVAGIYAGGDLTGPPMVAHKAYWEGLNMVESIYGEGPLNRPRFFPITIYSDPEIFSIGLSEGHPRSKIIKIPISVSGKAFSEGITGLIKIVVSEVDSKIDGIHIISEVASSISSLPSLMVENQLNYEYLVKTVFPHPTYGEALWEAFSSLKKLSIHFE